MSKTNIALVAAVAGFIAFGPAGCGGSSSVELGGTQGGDASTTAGTGGSGGSDVTGGGGSFETGGSSSGTGGAGGTSNGAGGTSSGAGGTSNGTGGSTSLDAGMGGSAGKGGASVADGGDRCKELITAYQAALVEAKRCNPGADALQCQALAPSSLPCPGCNTRVEDATKLTEIRMQWASAACKGGICPAIACILPGAPACIATDGGSGICSSLGLVR